MKKIVAIMLTALLLAGAALSVGAHKDIVPQIDTTVPTTLSDITIDGVKDAAYSGALKINLDSPQFANYNYQDDSYALGSAYILCSNDYHYLYVLAEILDDQMDMTEIPDEEWSTDGVEVFIDPTNASEMVEPVDPEEEDCTLAQGGTALQYRQNLSGKKSSSSRLYTTGEYIAEAYTLDNLFEAATGSINWNVSYCVEFKIDLTAYQSAAMGGITCQKGTTLGFQIMINDLFPERTNLCNNVLDELTDVPYNTHKLNNPYVWQTNEWSYITLGDAQTVPEERPDPVKPDVNGGDTTDDTTNNGTSNGTTNGSANGHTVNRVGDTLALSALALLAACGTAIVVSKKRR